MKLRNWQSVIFSIQIFNWGIIWLILQYAENFIVNTNTFVTILLSVLHSAAFFPQSSINKVSRMIVVEKMAKSL